MAKYEFRILVEGDGTGTYERMSWVALNGAWEDMKSDTTAGQGFGQGVVGTDKFPTSDSTGNDKFYFIDTDSDGLNFSSSNIYERILSMRMILNYDDGYSGPNQNTDIIDNIYFTGSNDNIARHIIDDRHYACFGAEGIWGFTDNPLSASLHKSKATDPTADMTGSIRFTYNHSASADFGNLKRYKFFGEKVCSVLGVPHNMWIYPETLRASATGSEPTFVRGNLMTQHLSVTDGITFSNISSVNSDISFRINGGRDTSGNPLSGSTDRWLKFININAQDTFPSTGVPENSLLMGWESEKGIFELKGGYDADLPGYKIFNVTASNMLLSNAGGGTLRVKGDAYFDGNIVGDAGTNITAINGIQATSVDATTIEGSTIKVGASGSGAIGDLELNGMTNQYIRQVWRTGHGGTVTHSIADTSKNTIKYMEAGQKHGSSARYCVSIGDLSGNYTNTMIYSLSKPWLRVSDNVGHRGVIGYGHLNETHTQAQPGCIPPDATLTVHKSQGSSWAISASNMTLGGVNGSAPTLKLYPVAEGAQIADTFAGNTDKFYLYFADNTNSNDPGYIMHETRRTTETNEGVLHLAPSDDNAYGDYVSIHGTNDADKIKLHTDGQIDGVTTLTANYLKQNSPTYVHIRRSSTNWTLPATTWTTVDFNYEDADWNNDYNLSTDTFTAPVTGMYQFIYNIRTDPSNDTSYLWGKLVVNGSTHWYADLFDTNEPDENLEYHTTQLIKNIPLAASDTVVFQMYAGDTGCTVTGENAGTNGCITLLYRTTLP